MRLGVFFGLLLVMAAWETARPARPQHKRLLRAANNLGVSALNTLLVRFLPPLALTGVASWSQSHGWGGLKALDIPSCTAIAISVVLLDLAVYGQHRLFHAIPILWRIHRMHHSDLEYDVTTGIRFHPLEILLSFAIKAAAITLIGAPALAVLIFEVVLNATSMFNHGNVRIAEPFDRMLRFCFVTPDMHRVHHSVMAAELNSNFGFNLSVWDRLFATYRREPEAGHTAMTIGLDDFRDDSELQILHMLSIPFRSPARSPVSPEKVERISVIIPVLNEATTIPHLLAALDTARKRGAEVIVVDGGSSDETIAVATPLADRVLKGPRGRAVQMNAGAAIAQGSILWFVHADCSPPVHGGDAILCAFENSSRVWGRFDVRIAPRSVMLAIVAASMNWRSRLTGIATGDQAIFVRRAAFDTVGGFPPIALMEDIALSKSLKHISAPACLKDQVETSARRWQANGIFRTILLMWRIRLAYFLGADPASLAAIYGYEPNGK